MGTIRVEPDPSVRESRCAECGGTSRLLHGYVYNDECAHGVYFVEWCDGRHTQRTTFITLGLGEFGEDAAAADRVSYAIAWTGDGMGLLHEPVRDRPDLLGEFVPRAEALEMPGVDHLWHVVDHLVADDPRLATVQQWLQSEDQR